MEKAIKNKIENKLETLKTELSSADFFNLWNLRKNYKKIFIFNTLSEINQILNKSIFFKFFLFEELLDTEKIPSWLNTKTISFNAKTTKDLEDIFNFLEFFYLDIKIDGIIIFNVYSFNSIEEEIKKEGGKNEDRR